MEKFQPPKLRALSEEELQAALAELPTDQSGLQKAQVILERQAVLRAVDRKEFEKWAAQMKEIGSQEALRAVNKAMGLEMPEPPAQTQIEQSKEIFTSPINIVSRRSLRTSRRTRSSLLTTFISWVAFTGFYGTVTQTMGYGLSDVIFGLLIGLVLSALVKLSLITHDNSPLYRSAAAFGAKSYKFFFFTLVAIFFGFAAVFAEKFATVSMVGFSYKPFGLEIANILTLVTMLMLAVLLGSLTKASIATWIQLIVISFALVFVIATQSMPAWSGFPSMVTIELVSTSTFAFTIAIVTTVVLKPHSRASLGDIALGQIVAALVAPVMLWFIFSIQEPAFGFTVFALAIFIMAALAISTAKENLGTQGSVFGSLAILIGLGVSWIAINFYGRELLLGFIVSYVVAITIDSLFRSEPLHIPSLKNSFGFYAGFSLSSFMVLAFGTAASWPYFSEHLEGFGISLDPASLAFIVALILGLARFFVVRGQDKEVSIVETRGNNLENLLGL